MKEHSMIYIRSFTSTFAQYGEFDTNKGIFRVVKKELSTNDVIELQSIFSELNNSYLVLFVDKKAQTIFYKDELYVLPQNYIFEYSRMDEKFCKIMWLDSKRKIILDITYEQPDLGMIDRLGWTESEEDYNFGLYLYKQFMDQKI